MAAHLLMIPLELRILICKFALTDPEHVNYREDESRNWRLCYQVTAREEIERIKTKKRFQELKAHYGTRSSRPITRAYASKVRDAHNKRLQDADEEAEDAKARLKILESKDYVWFTGQIVMNQLHYVCRQLRHETRGLAAICNPILLTPRDLLRTQDVLENFLRDCPSKVKGQIRTLFIRPIENPIEDRPMFLNEYIWKFGMEHPHITMKLHHIPAVRSQAWLLYMLFTIKSKFRGDEMWGEKFLTEKTARTLRDRALGTTAFFWLDEWDKRVPENIRLLPWTDFFNEAKFRTNNLNDPTWSFGTQAGAGLEPVFTDVDGAVRMIKEGLKNGM
jgi:hypothetical protein